MQFKLIDDSSTKLLHYKLNSTDEFTVVDLGMIDTPTDPQQLFDFITQKLRDIGAVRPDSIFALNHP